MFARILQLNYSSRMNVRTLFSICVSLCLFVSAQAQIQAPKDSMPIHKNVVRANISYPLLFGGNNYVLGYERILKPNQSFSINAGWTNLPKITSLDVDSILNISEESETRGYNVSADYRFYLKKRNKFPAPNGLYIGPYAFMYVFERKTNINYQSGGAPIDINTKINMNIFGAGFELGYQFVLWKGLTLDLVLIGPGIANYTFKARLDSDSDLDVVEESEIYDALKIWLTEKYPGADFVWGDKSFDANGNMNTTDIGYRYLIHIGYNF